MIFVPRSKKYTSAMSAAEQIKAIKAEIEELNAQIKEDKAELKRLEAELRDEEKENLMKAIDASGKTVSDVLDWLKVLD